MPLRQSFRLIRIGQLANEADLVCWTGWAGLNSGVVGEHGGKLACRPVPM